MAVTRQPELSVGDLVVYASHGVGRVVTRKEVRGAAEGSVVIGFPEGLTVTLPLDRALGYLRPLASESDIRSVRNALRAEESKSDEVWQKRLKTMKAKVSGGVALELAEVVRDAAHRHRKLTGRGEPGRLSVSERQLYLKARKLLADEIGLSRGVEADKAEEWIDEQLAQAPV